MPRPSLALLLALGLLALPAPASADDPKPEGKPGNGEKTEAPADAPAEKPKEKEAPATVVAEKGPFVVWVEAAGTLEPVGATEVRVELDAYGGELEIVEVAPPGPVRKGELLVRFDPEKLDEQLSAAEKDGAIATQALAKQEEEAKRAEEGARLGMERAVVEKTRADQSLEQFTKVDRPLRTKEAEHRLQGTRDNIQDQEEELDQLRKMYQADDLVEGTEEIVMRRSERSLSRSKTWLGYQTTRNKTLLEVELPREQETLELEAKKEAFELDRLRATQTPALAQARLELEKARLAAERGSKALAKLRADRERLTLLSPADGFAVPGAFAKGKWTALDDATRALKKGETVRAKQVLWTVVQPGSVLVRASVPEASLLSVQVGQPAEVTLGVQPDRKLEARVARVARTSSDGNFEVHLDLAAKDERWMPGWSAKSRDPHDRARGRGHGPRGERDVGRRQALRPRRRRGRRDAARGLGRRDERRTDGDRLRPRGRRARAEVPAQEEGRKEGRGVEGQVTARRPRRPLATATFAAAMLLAALAPGSVPARAAPPSAAEKGHPAPDLATAIDRGVAHLVASQRKDGSWGSTASNLWDIYAPVPGSFHAFQSAVTALATSALVEVGEGKPGVGRGRAPRRDVAAGEPRQGAARRPRHDLQRLDARLRARGVRAAPAGRTPTPRGRRRCREARSRWTSSPLRVRRTAAGATTTSTARSASPGPSPRRSRRRPRSSRSNGARRRASRSRSASSTAASRSSRRCAKPDGSYAYSWDHLYWPQGGINKIKGSLGRTSVC